MVVSKAKIQKIKKFVLKKVAKLDYNHDQDHTIRTVKLAKILAKKEKANIEICEVAAYLHDIGQSVRYKGHEAISEKMTKKFLKSLKLPNDFIEKVCDAVRHHNGKDVKKAKTFEAKIIHDADKLQAVGIFSFCRVLTDRTVFHNLSLKEAMDFMPKFQEKRFNSFETKSAKNLIRSSHKFVKEFYKLYNKEDKAKF